MAVIALITLLLMHLLLLFIAWKQRKCWKLIWRLNGWSGVLHQPLLWILLFTNLDPQNILNLTCRLRKYFRRPLAMIVGFSVLLYVDDPISMESILNSPECLDKTFLQNGFFARKGLLHAKAVSGPTAQVVREVSAAKLEPPTNGGTTPFSVFKLHFEIKVVHNYWEEDSVVAALIVSLKGAAAEPLQTVPVAERRSYQKASTTAGQKWKIRRKQLNPAFSHSNLLSFLSTFNSVGNELVQQFRRKLKGDDVKFKDVEDLLSRAVLEVSCQTTMGTRANMIGDYTPGMAQIYKKLLEISAMKIIRPWTQIDFLFRLFNRRNYECSKHSNELATDFVNDIVQSRQRRWVEKKNTEESNVSEEQSQEQNAAPEFGRLGVSKKRIFIDQIFHLAETGELALQDIIDEAQSMVLVSFETISNSVTIALLCLAIKRECQQKLREEIHLVLGTKEVLCNIEFAHLKQMKYLDMVVNECLRLLATVPMNMRHVSQDCSLLLPTSDSGSATIELPQNSILVLDTFNMQRDVNYWGPRARQFHPEHFDPAHKSSRHPYAFLPFSKGIRYCIGAQYSYWLTKVLLIKLISKFEFRSDARLEDLEFVEGISLKFGNADKITFEIHEI